MDYRRRRTDVVRLRLFMCFKGGSFIPRVHAPPSSELSSPPVLRFRRTAPGLLCACESRHPNEFGTVFAHYFLQSLPIESGKTPDSMTAAFQIISRVELP